MDVTHQVQPTKTSCGPTCVAMLVGMPVAAVLAALPKVRVSPARQRLRVGSHRTNVGEMCRLLKPYGFWLGRRLRGVPSPSDHPIVLRIQHPRGMNWHFSVCVDGWVYDPARPAPVSMVEYFAGIAPSRVSWYEVTT